ncbi:helix-turn-helix domain-containing protein [Inquilinus sp. KBS0705]|nr:helix-turn-helix domain-containing protein [Inquilinus sp. KBS0705]
MQSIPVRHLQASQKEPNLSDAFSIRNIEKMLEGQDMVQHLHRHDFYYLLALTNGAGTHNIDFTPYNVADYTVFFMRPGQVHELVLKSGSAGYLMQFDTDFYFPKDKMSGQLLRKASIVNHYQLQGGSFKKLCSIFNFMEQEFIERNERYEDVIKANLGIIFIELLRRQDVLPTKKAGLYTQERLERFLELLEHHVFTHKQVAQYAEMLNLSVYQLNAIAKATLGKTCSEVINEQIVLEAKRCLLATSNQINQTAYRLGYEDVSYFIRFFKKQTGFSPEAFRNNFR